MRAGSARIGYPATGRPRPPGPPPPDPDLTSPDLAAAGPTWPWRAPAGRERRHDPGLAVAVRRDDPFGHPGDLHDRLQLGERELLVDRVVDLAQHAAGGAHLDDFGIPAQLLPYGLRALGRPVGEPQLADVGH